MFGTMHTKMDEVKHVEDNITICVNRQYLFNFFKRCISQILLGSFLDPLSHLYFLICRFHNYRHIDSHLLSATWYTTLAVVYAGVRTTIL